MSQIKVRVAEEGALPVNEKLAGIVPMALPEEQVALLNDIAVHGQRDPILLWRGQVVDGRCRQKALLSLQRHILYKELDNSLTETDIKCLVKSMNTRRNLTATQKTASAAREYDKEENKASVRQLADSWGVSVSILENAVWLQRSYPNVIESLFNGKSVPIKNIKGEPTTSNKVSAIYAFYKRELQQAKEVKEYGWQDGTSINTQAGKEWYYSVLRDLPEKNISLQLKGLLIEMANLKFKAETEVITTE